MSNPRLLHCGIVVSGLVGMVVTSQGCTNQADTGIVLGCFGFVNESISGADVSQDVPANMYFGGCNPDDPGLQFLVRALPTVSPDDPAAIAACNDACKQRFAGYSTSHQSISLLPLLNCQTLFTAKCDGLRSDTRGLSSAKVADLQGGGPTDSRFILSGTARITLDHRSVDVPVMGAADVTIAENCDSSGCPLIMSRFDVVATQSVVINGLPIDSAHVQNQGVIYGHVTNTQFVFAPGDFKLGVSYTTAGEDLGFFVFNDDEWVTHAESGHNLLQFFPDFHGFFGDGELDLRLSATLDQHRPVASLAPSSPKYECTCAECTPVTLLSTSVDQDQDLQDLTWMVNKKIHTDDGANSPEALSLQLPLNSYRVDLFATDSRGAVSMASVKFDVVDTTPPVVTAPPAATMQSCGFPDIGVATATDICSDVILTSDDPGIFRPGVTTTVTFRAEDSSLNDGVASTTMTQVKVDDQDRPQCCPPWTTTVLWALPGQRLDGTDGPDCLIGTDGDDTIDGKGGDDYIIGGPGNDHLYGGEGDDTIVGNEGNDFIEGGGGKDRLAGGSGDDRIFGDYEGKTTPTDDDDFILAGEGDDFVDGGDGNNRIFGGPGLDHLQAGSGNDWIDGGSGPDVIRGGAGNDILIGGVGVDRDQIEGGPDDDLLAGLDGDDDLDGGPGNDDIRGGRGNNVCKGGGGAPDHDTFHFCQTQR